MQAPPAETIAAAPGTTATSADGEINDAATSTTEGEADEEEEDEDKEPPLDPTILSLIPNALLVRVCALTSAFGI